MNEFISLPEVLDNNWPFVLNLPCLHVGLESISLFQMSPNR